MRAEIIAIGDELTSGQRLDTNTQWLAERLNEIGVPVAFHTTVSDDMAANVLVFRAASERADVIVSSGGLGPTADDLTRHALAEMTGAPLVQDEAAVAHIRSLFARRKREMPAANLVQAMFPAGSRMIFNPHGTAPGIDLTVKQGEKQSRIFCLPGVPAEMKEMWTGSVAPSIQQLLGVQRIISHYRIKCFGVGESGLEAMLPDLIRRGRQPSVGITVSKATITLRITAEGETVDAARAAMQPTIETIRECLGDLIYGEEDDELTHAVLRQLRRTQSSLRVVEFGPGGMLSHWLSDSETPGGVWRGGIVLPANKWPVDSVNGKLSDAELLSLATSMSVVDADYTLIVGPFPQVGGVGQVFTAAVVSPDGRVNQAAYPYAGHPDILKSRACKQALNLLRLQLTAASE